MKKNNTGYPSIDRPQDIGHTFLQKKPVIPNVSVYNAVRLLSSFYKESTAINCLDLDVNYKEMIDDSVSISMALKELGVKKGDIISVCMPNFYQAVAVFLDCNRIGAVTTFLNNGASQNEINEYLNLFSSPVFINFDKSIEENESIKSKTGVKYIVTLNKKDINNRLLNRNYKITANESILDFNSLSDIAKYQKRNIEFMSSKNDSLILFTSGSTGKPKSVVLTNENILAAGTYLKNSSGATSLNGDKTLVCVPFTYPYGFATSTLMTLLTGKTAILAPNISNETISYYLKKEPNIIFGSPALLELIMKNVSKEQDLSFVNTFVSGGDFLSVQQNQRGVDFFKEHGSNNIVIGNGSGNAETVSCGTNPIGLKVKPETAGKILVGTSAMIVDPDTLEEKKYGEEGLLLVSGKHVFKEYFNDPKLTNQAKIVIDNKTYFKTGTLGSIDSEGYFHLSGRESRFYIISTLNKVYCDHVQTLLSALDCVENCAVVKVPDDDMLYTSKAYIVLKPGYTPDNDTLEYIKDLCKKPITVRNDDIEQLKWYEIPTYFEFVSELPRKKGTDKIDYSLLEDKAKNELDNNSYVLSLKTK